MVVNGAERHHSTPWLLEEYLMIDGRRYVYTIEEDGPVVHFPGGAHVPLSELDPQGCQIEKPKRWRAGLAA
jgi:hypothetical protein